LVINVTDLVFFLIFFAVLVLYTPKYANFVAEINYCFFL